jgi:hypothetical protein
MKRKVVVLPAILLIVGGCAVNPDADKALRDEQRRSDSIAASERAVQPLAIDTGQHDMPVAPVAPGDMPVVNPADSTGHKPL